MGVGFSNFNVMQWNTSVPLPHALLQEQRLRESSKVDREEESLSSNRPELVALRECLEEHEDHIDLLYLTEVSQTQVRHQDQRRMLESIMHCFPSNFWRNKITNNKESDKCDL
jgi:hypothetical protein